MKKLVKITVDDGDMFEGTVEQFQDCFFSNADEGTIRGWAAREKYKVEFVWDDGTTETIDPLK